MPTIHEKLSILYDALVDNAATFEQEMTGLIKQPANIPDTNRFASLLVELNNFKLIAPLLLQISLGKKGDRWLCDFLYAAIKILHETSEDDEVDTPPNLVPKLGDWIINATGELAWKAAGLLKFNPSEEAEKIQMLKLEQRGDFFLTYVDCVLGLLHYNETKYLPLVKQMAADDTRGIDLREFCQKVIDEKQ